MRFDENRAKALAEYALYGILQQAMAGNALPNREKRFVVSISKTALAAALGHLRLHLDHVEVVAKAAARWGIATGDLGSNYFFFMPEEIEVLDIDHLIGPATAAFARVYNSPACDELYEDEAWWPENKSKPVATKPTGGRKKAA